ncbi:hypothetical protein MMC34_004547 [Xylographa carneopallida]|nr:hypothetical protein [Xylographa carneopallida]
MSSSQALTKRSLDTSLMPPPPPPKRIKRPAKVIDEDTYTDALSHIIARDFFPGLVEAESQQDYLNALDSQDSEWIESAGRKLTEVMTPGPDGRRIRGRRGTSMTPMTGLHGRGGETPKGWGGDTPMSVVSITSTATTQTEKPDVDTNLSLSAFQQKYTSEDNESFYRLLDKQNLKKSEKYAWMWAHNRIPAARQIAHRQRQERLLAARNADALADGTTNGALAIEDVTHDARPAMPDAWPSHHPENNLMFGPSSVEDTHQTVQQRAEDTSRVAPKAVVYDNTRLPAPTAYPDPAAIPPSPSLSAVHDALAGHPRLSASEAALAGGATPRVNGYAFVDAAPSPSPSDIASSSSWGDLPASALLGAGDATPNPFRIKEGSRREALHHRMVDKVAKGKRASKREAELRSPVAVPRFASSPRVGKGGLTPAAQKLLGRMGGLEHGVGEGRTPRVGSRLRGEWTQGRGEGK